uniref:carbohydrate kinase family protein n=1 Tax=Gelidibacter sp. TaxID=2018083 RepID=UPI0040490FF5
MKTSHSPIDILCVGETLIDFIGQQSTLTLDDTTDFHRYLGGSPTNVAMNSARLGLNTALVASVGNDSFGNYIIDRLNEIEINISNVKRLENIPTSVIFVSRSADTPDFIPYREADSFITEDQLPSSLLSNLKIFHTTCFALSKNPARTTILAKAEEAYNLGSKLSIDINYSEKIWRETDDAIEVIKHYCRFNPLVKISEDDMERLFQTSMTHEQMFRFFHENGVDIVCLTLGKNGVKLSNKNGPLIILPAIKINKIVDATGAGDAFWSGFLFAYSKEKSLTESLDIALKLAALKLQNVGRLPDNITIISEILKK